MERKMGGYGSGRRWHFDALETDKIRDRLEWEPGILNGEGLKPKGMHWSTFNRLKKKHNRLVKISLQEASLKFGLDVGDL
jgi:hypothetical protein